MTGMPHSDQHEVVADSLSRCAQAVETIGRGRWRLAVPAGAAPAAAAWLEEGWLCLDVPAPAHLRPAHASDLWQLLTANRDMLGGGKFALMRDGRSLSLRAEMPIDNDIDLERRVREAICGFRAASGDADSVTGTADAVVHETAAPCDLRRLCEEAGWPLIERTSGVCVSLEVGDGLYQADLPAAPSPGESRISVRLFELEQAPPPVRDALGVLLLCACGALRMVRVVGVDDGEHQRVSAELEVAFATPPCAAEVTHALAALSIACRACGGEVAALQSTDIATTYLAMRGW